MEYTSPTPGSLAHTVLVEAVAEPGITLAAITREYRTLRTSPAAQTSLIRAARALVGAGLLESRAPRAEGRGTEYWPTADGVRAVHTSVSSPACRRGT